MIDEEVQQVKTESELDTGFKGDIILPTWLFVDEIHI